jgi:transposase-like protein
MSQYNRQTPALSLGFSREVQRTIARKRKSYARRTLVLVGFFIEQDYRFIKHKIKPVLVFYSYPTAWRIISGYEAMHMIRKGQIQGADKGDVRTQNQFVAGLFGLAM